MHALICFFCATTIFAAASVEKESTDSSNTEKNIFVPKNKPEASFGKSDHHSNNGHNLIHSFNFSADLFHNRNKQYQNGYLHAFIPLAYNNLNNYLFFIPGITLNKSRQTYNAGVGFRSLNDAKNLLSGFNIFYDHSAKCGHNRISTGAELAIKHVHLSGNIYYGLNNKWRMSKHNDLLQKKISNGHDIKLKVQVPSHPQVGISVGYFHWKGKQVDLYGDKHYVKSPFGITYAVEYKPVSMAGIEIKRTLNRQRNNTRLMFNVVYNFNQPLQKQLQLHRSSDTKPLSSKLFNYIQREGHIVFNTNKITIKPMTTLNANLTRPSGRIPGNRPSQLPLRSDPATLTAGAHSPTLPAESLLNDAINEYPPNNPINFDSPVSSCSGNDSDSDSDSDSDTLSLASSGRYARLPDDIPEEVSVNEGNYEVYMSDKDLTEDE